MNRFVGFAHLFREQLTLFHLCLIITKTIRHWNIGTEYAMLYALSLQYVLEFILRLVMYLAS
jgi:hypothetical protein